MAAHINVRPVPPSPTDLGHPIAPGGGAGPLGAWAGDAQSAIVNLTALAVAHYIVEPTSSVLGVLTYYAGEVSSYASTHAYHVWLDVRDMNWPAVYEPGSASNLSLLALLLAGIVIFVHKFALRMVG